MTLLFIAEGIKEHHNYACFLEATSGKMIDRAYEEQFVMSSITFLGSEDVAIYGFSGY